MKKKKSIIGETVSSGKLGILGFSVSWIKNTEKEIVTKEGFNPEDPNLCTQVNEFERLTFLVREINIGQNYKILKEIKA